MTMPEMAQAVSTCVHCGFCVPVCPTWDILREENDSPRGRLYLTRAEAEGRVDPARAFAMHIGRCLGCRACESVCPAGVPYGQLLEKARATRKEVALEEARGSLLDFTIPIPLPKSVERIVGLKDATGKLERVARTRVTSPRPTLALDGLRPRSA